MHQSDARRTIPETGALPPRTRVGWLPLQQGITMPEKRDGPRSTRATKGGLMQKKNAVQDKA